MRVNRRHSDERLETLAGPLSFLLTPWGAIATCIIGWALTAPLSNSPIAVGLCWWGIALLLFSIQIEKPWLVVFPFPPLSVLSLHLFLRWELGGLIGLISSKSSGEMTIWKEYLPNALAINAAFTSALVLVGLVNFGFIRKKTVARPNFLDSESGSSEANLKRFLALALVTSIVAIGYSCVGYFSGTLDRGAAYLKWAGRLWRPDTFFSATIRLRDIFFVILPVIAIKWRRFPAVVGLLLVATVISFLLTSLLGGRGLLIYPVILIIGGSWLAGVRPLVIRTALVIALASALIVIPSFSFMTSSLDFSQSDAINISQRLAIWRNSLRTATTDNRSTTMLGRELYAWSDPHLFNKPALEQKPAGYAGLENLRFLWIPRFIYPNRPELNDGHLIANEIMGKPDQGKYQGRYVSFKSISFGGDLYRRFRWPGVVIGSLIFALVYAGFCRFWYAFAAFNGSIYQLLLALLPATFLQGPPLRSVSETAWNWLYELPKYALLLFAIGMLIDFLTGQMQLLRRSARNQ